MRINSATSDLLDYKLSKSIVARHLFNSVHIRSTLARNAIYNSRSLNHFQHSLVPSSISNTDLHPTVSKLTP